MKTFILMTSVVILIFLVVSKSKKLHRQGLLLSELTNWHKIALTDDLTQIPNRAAYSNHIEKYKNADCFANFNPAIILFDIDNFKLINDTYGHLAGDDILRKCARLLCDVFSHPSCTVYRIGGDEFAVILRNMPENYIIERLLDIKAAEINGLGFRMSKGYAVSTGKSDFLNMFKNADEMLYADKFSKKH